MQNEFSLLEQRIMQSLIKDRSDAEIADILERDVTGVREYTSHYARTRNISSRQSILDMREAKKNGNLLRKKQLDEKLKKQMAAKKNHVSSLKRKREKIFKTIAIDLSKKIAVKIDNRTTVFVDPGTDTELYKREYYNKIKNSQVKHLPLSRQKTISNFKPLP